MYPVFPGAIVCASCERHKYNKVLTFSAGNHVLILAYVGEAPERDSADDAKGARVMDRMIAKLNIEHYRKLLASEVDEAKRQMLGRLLAEEEAKLATMNAPERRKESG